MLMGPGENAGAVSIGDGWAVAFKVESHNHPSAVEPFQGAATGVGGILRDVFALGARPIAILDSLRFGELDSERSRYLFEQVVAGIGHYGNSIGVPTVGGEVYFEPPYEQNCLVNAMCVGLARADEMVRAAAAGVGNAVVLMGASTGRDGIGGASVLASAELEDGDDSKRPTVQIGDPFEESKVARVLPRAARRRACWSRSRTSAPRGSPPRPAEMASAGGVGIDIDVGQGAAARGRHGAVRDHGLGVAGADARGRRAGEGRRRSWRCASAGRPAPRSSARSPTPARFRVLRDGEVVGEMPVVALVDDCPLYDLAPSEPEGWIYGNAAHAREELRRRRARRSSALLASSQHRQQAMGVRAVRLDRRLAHRAPARDCRRRRAASPRGRRDDRDRDRRQRAAGRVRSLRGHDRGGARVRAEPRLRRRRAARAHQLPQLRQPREADGRLAARPLDPGARRRLRGARRAGGRRQRLALQRDRGRARSTRRRWSAWSASCPIPRAPAGSRCARAMRSRLVGPFAPALAGSELAKLRGELGPGLPEAADRRVVAAIVLRPRRGARRHASTPRTTSATAAWPARSRRWRSPVGSARPWSWTRLPRTS